MDKSQPCKYFLKGVCKYGKNCRFSHDININMRPNNSSNTDNNPMNQQNSNSHNCIHFMKGNCTRGDKCAYFHGYCNRLQHIKTINNQKNLVKELISAGNTSYISVDDNELFVRKLENVNESDDESDKIPEGYKIGKVIFSGNKIIYSFENLT